MLCSLGGLRLTAEISLASNSETHLSLSLKMCCFFRILRCAEQCTKSTATENRNKTQARNHALSSDPLLPSDWPKTRGALSQFRRTPCPPRSPRPASRCLRKETALATGPSPARALQSVPIRCRDAGPAEPRVKETTPCSGNALGPSSQLLGRTVWLCVHLSLFSRGSGSGTAAERTGSLNRAQWLRETKLPVSLPHCSLCSPHWKAGRRSPSIQLHGERAGVPT